MPSKPKEKPIPEEKPVPEEKPNEPEDQSPPATTPAMQFARPKRLNLEEIGKRLNTLDREVQELRVSLRQAVAYQKAKAALDAKAKGN